MNTDYWQCQHTFGHILKQYNKLLQFKTLLSKPILLYSIFSLSNNNCGSDCKNDGTSLPLRVNTTGTMRRCGSSLIASLKLMPHPTLSPLLHVGPNARPCEFDLNSLQNTDQYKQRFQKKMFVFINQLSAANSGLTGVIAVLNSTMGILCISRQPL